ncbi:MAG TPA: hypothetical protein VFG23_15945 [Polyangia bacterium]|nr:hypothetical protein [Polyangia bacterium]
MKKPDFKISASASMKAQYRDLLKRDLSDETLEESLALIRRVLETNGRRIAFDWERRPTARKHQRYEIPAAANDYLKEFLERANASLPTEMPDEVGEKTVLERRTQEAVVFLTFQSRVTLQGDWGFVRDVQSLLFQLCIHSLSARLSSRHLEEANAYLLHALYAHAQLAWTDVPAHQHYLLSSLFEHSGDRPAALQFLAASLENSSPDDHDFLTKAQSYWSLLVEDDRSDEAKSFALNLYRRAAPKDLVEVQKLIDETYALESGVEQAS